MSACDLCDTVAFWRTVAVLQACVFTVAAGMAWVALRGNR